MSPPRQVRAPEGSRTGANSDGLGPRPTGRSRAGTVAPRGGGGQRRGGRAANPTPLWHTPRQPRMGRVAGGAASGTWQGRRGTHTRGLRRLAARALRSAPPPPRPPSDGKDGGQAGQDGLNSPRMRTRLGTAQHAHAPALDAPRPGKRRGATTPPSDWRSAPHTPVVAAAVTC
eukprot:1747456-Pleurochrysis_carterae.AAC.1